MRRGCGISPPERVRRRPEFERAYSEGTRIHARFMTVFVVPNTVSHPRLGVAATRKLGGAVVRNRAKRLARELFRRHKTGPLFEAQSGLDIVIVPRREMLDAPFVSLEADYASALERRHQNPARTRRPAGRRRSARAD
jgi:ribonuclease P protein component